MVFVEEDVPAMVAYARHQRRGVLPFRLDDERVAQAGFGNLALPRRAAQAMGREGALPVRRRRDLVVLTDVVVGAGDDANAVSVSVVCELAEIGDELLGIRYVELAVCLHEIVLGIDVPEDDARVGHGTGNLDGQQLKRQRYRHLVTRVLAGTTGTVCPNFQGELLFFRDPEAKSHEEQRFPSQTEYLREAKRPRVEHQRFNERLSHAPALLIVSHGQPCDFGERGTVHLEASRTDDRAIRCHGDDVLFDVATQVVVGPRQQITGRDEWRHELFHLGDVRECRRAECRLRTRSRSWLYRDAGHASTSSRIATPRSSSSVVTVSGGTMRMTVGPAVSTSSRRSRAAATTGVAASFSSSPQMSPRPRASRTRARRVASPPSATPSRAPLARTAPRKSGSAIARKTSSATLATNGPPPNVVA